MWTVIICLFFGTLLGLFLGMSTWLAYDKRHEKREKERAKHLVMDATETYCDVNCRVYDEIFCQYKNPDLAMDILVTNHCENCPVYKAQEIIEESEGCK